MKVVLLLAVHFNINTLIVLLNYTDNR